MEPKHTYGDCSIVQATMFHANKLKDNLRFHDALECELLGHTPKEALSLALSLDYKTYTALGPDKEPFAMFGSGSSEDGGYIWMLGTPDVTKHKKNFVQASRAWVQYLSKPFGITSNVVLKDNKQAIRWLKFCGAKFLQEVEISSHSFYEFIITTK